MLQIKFRIVQCELDKCGFIVDLLEYQLQNYVN